MQENAYRASIDTANNEKSELEMTFLDSISQADGERDSSKRSPLLSVDESDLRSLCRRQLETLEHWSRRIISDQFTSSYGEEYWNAVLPDGRQLVKSSIRKNVENRMQKNQKSYPRWINAVQLDDIEYFICRDDLYRTHFKSVFEPFYSGNSEVRSVFDRLVVVRNKLSHSNAISIHEAEQALCYSDDIVSCFKAYYCKRGKSRKYNVPYFVRAVDSMGNEFSRRDFEFDWTIFVLPNDDPSCFEMIELRSGDCYKIWAEVDGAFPEDSYEIKWVVRCGSRIESGCGNAAEVVLCDSDVSTKLEIDFVLTTHNDWHKHVDKFNRSRDYDDKIEWRANLGILPPIESTY